MQLPTSLTLPRKGNLNWKQVYALLAKGTYMTRAFTAYLQITHGNLSESDLEHAFYMCVLYGHTNLIRTLLHQGIDPSVCDNRAIVAAADKGHLKIVRLLLADRRVDENSDVSRGAFARSASKGHLKIMQLIAKDPRFGANTTWGLGLICSAADGRSNVLLHILSNYVNFIPMSKIFNALNFACDGGHVDCVGFLLPFITRDAWTNDRPFQSPMRVGHIRIVSMLFERTKVLDVRCDISIPFLIAVEGGHRHCVEMALNNTQHEIIRTIPHRDPLTIARRNGDSDMVRLLRTDARIQ